eukprot:2201837-Pleurochrysis_carterae.AAC.1
MRPDAPPVPAADAGRSLPRTTLYHSGGVGGFHLLLGSLVVRFWRFWAIGEGSSSERSEIS